MSKNRDLILSSARKLFSAKSIEDVTIKEICQNAGVAISTFYYHFKTKEELLDYFRFRDERPDNRALLDILSTPDLYEQVMIACTRCAARAIAQGHVLTTQYYTRRLATKKLEESIIQLYAQEESTAAMLIERSQNAGMLRNPSPPDLLAKAAIGLVNDSLINWCYASGTYDLMEACRRSLRTLFGIPE